MMDENVTPEDLQVDIFAMRHLITRSSPAVVLMVNRIERRWHLYSRLQQDNMQQYINEEIKHGTVEAPYGELWERILALPLSPESKAAMVVS